MSIKDVASRAGVSFGTVSKVLNGDETARISPATRLRVRRAAEELNYHPNSTARALKTGRSNLIALWIVRPQTPYYGSVFHALREHLSRHGLETILSETDDAWASDVGDAQHPLTFPSSLARLPVDGIIAVDSPARIDAWLRGREAPSVPIVSVGAYGSERVDSIGLDLTSATEDAVRHLAGLGCRRVAYLTTEAEHHDGGFKDTGYRRAIAEAGLTPEFILVPDGTRRTARHHIAAYVRRSGCPDGMYCRDDVVAIGAYRGLLDVGIRVPHDIALIGCDGIEEAEFLECPLTTVVSPVIRLAETAVEMLRLRLRDPGRPRQQEVLRPELVIRESSRR